MTNPVIDEIHTLANAALKSGQDQMQVHVFPFRPTEARLRTYALHEWYDFWRNLKDVHDAFELTKRPPRVSVCEGRYWVEKDGPGEVGPQGPLAVCGVPATSQNFPTANAPLTSGVNWLPRPSAALDPSTAPQVAAVSPQRPGQVGLRRGPAIGRPNLQAQAHLLPSRQIQIACVASTASCRKWIAGQIRVQDNRLAAARTASARK